MKIIELTRGLFAIVDDEDFENVSKHWWQAHECNKKFYATTHIGEKTVYMHRFIFCETALHVDHKNRLTLDNRRENLRSATVEQNLANMRPSRTSESGFVGVRKTIHGKWQAYLSVGNRQKYVGTFKTPQEAAEARDATALRLRGEFATLNITPTSTQKPNNL